MKIVIGARGSKLSQIQTTIIKNLLLEKDPKLQIEIKVIKTMGDNNMNPIPLDTIGKGWFTRELDKALLENTIDLAVHSLKDLPEILPDELCIAAIPRREDAREALVSNNGLTFDSLPKHAAIGTDSTRRKTQILHKRNDITVKSVRGNINTRIEKLDRGEYDALLLAVAGLKRLGISHRITQYFSVSEMIPAPGQGALAIVTRKSDTAINKLLTSINHKQTVKEVTAERTFSKAFGGGCKMPVGAYASSKGDTITLSGMVGSLDGKKIETIKTSSNILGSEQLGKKLANRLLKKAKWFDAKRYVVMTRPKDKDDLFIKQLEKIGIAVLSYPTITITENALTKEMIFQLSDLASFDWIIFTSKNGVEYFIKLLKTYKIDKSILQTKRIAAVGSATADEIKKHGLPVNFVPSKFTTDTLGQEIPAIKGEKILLARSKIANPKLEKILQKKGASVVNLPIYKTQSVVPNLQTFTALKENGQINCITFTSPSTVKGFVKSFNNSTYKKEIFSVPVLSIGPVTTAEAKKQGFQIIYTAETHTLEGLITKLKQVIL